MNDSERQSLSRFLEQLREARANHPDAEAAGLIREAVATNPDAGYLLVQRAMLLEQALNQAKQQLSRVRQQPEPPARGAGSRQTDPWTSAGAVGAGQSPGPSAAPNPRFGVPSASGSGSFLGNVAATAAGVVAGSFLYQGIEHLLGHGPLGDGIHGSVSGPLEETTINNFYGAADDDQAWSTESRADDDMPDDGLDSFGDDTFLQGVDDSDWV